MLFPDKFCHGHGGFNEQQGYKLTYRKYFNQRLLDCDGRFEKDTEYLFMAQYIVESKQINDDGNHFIIWQQKVGRLHCNTPLTVRQLKNSQHLAEFCIMIKCTDVLNMYEEHHHIIKKCLMIC